MKVAIILVVITLLNIFSVLICPAAEIAQRAVKSTTSKPAEQPPPAILSIIPAQAEPGSKVTIFGANLGELASVFLGTIEVQGKVTDKKQLEFFIPQLDAGLYALYLKRADGVTGKVYNFSVLPLRPVVSSINPEKISSCAQGKEREITVTGKNFTETSLLFFDNAAIRSRVVATDSIIFRIPQVLGGLHQIMVRNGVDTASLPLTVEIETKPDISQVVVGDNFVNYYELHIEGRNFQQNSTVYVDGIRIGGNGGRDGGEREKLIFVDCTKLVYQRHPYSPVGKDFRLQVVNPGEEGSQVVTVTAP